MISASKLRSRTGGVLLAAGLALAPAVQAAACGVQTAPDGLRVMANRDVAGERWAITRHPSGIVTGNVFFADGGAPAFIACTPGDLEGQYRCLGGNGCATEALETGRAVSVDPIGGLLLVNKDVGGERWAITQNDDGTLTGNVFGDDGSAPSFIFCEPNGAPDGFSCSGAGPCTAEPCGTDFASLGDVTLPADFLAVPEACADAYDLIGNAVAFPPGLFDPAGCQDGGPPATCGNDVREAGELCDGTDDAVCPGECTAGCGCPSSGQLELFVESGSTLDAGWTGTVHGLQFQRGARIVGQLSNCDGDADPLCDFFANIGSYCSGDPSLSCTNDDQCAGSGPCVLQHFGPPLPLSVGGVPACIVMRHAADAAGTYDRQSGAATFTLGLNAVAHVAFFGNGDPCPICDCGAADMQDCAIGDAGTCVGGGDGACTVQGTGLFGPTSLDCRPSDGSNVTGGGIQMAFDSVTTDTLAFPTNQPCDGGPFQDFGCWCDGQTQPNQCQAACDGGTNDTGSCGDDADCPGGGRCAPLCRQIAGAALGKGECVAGPTVETCAGSPQTGCANDGDCPSGTGPCISRNQSCFPDPLVLEGSPGIASNRLVASGCVPSAGGAMDQTAGLPGPAAIALPTSVHVTECGDGIANGSEECDGADDATCPGACQANCSCPSTCGNDTLEAGEQCDGLASTACPGQCTPAGAANECQCPGSGGGDAECGNHMIEPGEVCEFPALGCGPLQLCFFCNQCVPDFDLGSFPVPGPLPLPF